jgi:hypothetical protein
MEDTTQPVTITIADLDVLKNIVDLASARGAFRGAELAEVGAVYNKLTQFLETVVAQAKAQADATEPTNPGE